MKKLLFIILLVPNLAQGKILTITNSAHFERICQQATPGDTVYVRAGTYNLGEVFLDRRKGHGGALGQYVTIKNHPGESPVIRRASRRFIIWTDYVRVEGLAFQGGSLWRIDCFGKGNQIVDNTFTGIQPRYGVIEMGGRDLLIEGNTINITDGARTTDHGIYLHKSQNVVIRGNTITGAAGYGIHIYDEQKSSNENLWEPFAIRNITVEGNTIKNCRLRSGVILAKGRGGNTITVQDIFIKNNVFEGNAGYGVLLRTGKNISVTGNKFNGNHLQPQLFALSGVSYSASGNTFNGTVEPPTEPPPKDDPPITENDTLTFNGKIKILINGEVVIIRKKE